MMNRRTLSLSLLVFASTLLLSAKAYADSITFSLASPIQSAQAGSTVSFTATVKAAAGNSGNIFLNGDNFNAGVPLAVDDTGFFTNFPFFLTPGQSFTGLLFTATLPGGTAPGQYKGTFSLLGGGNDAAQILLGQTAFEVDVPKPTGPSVPEPASLLLLVTGLPGVVAAMRRRGLARS